ncbi:MAG: DUF5805 domain-containing protein [Halalkalicoccus sp.]
MVSGPDTERTAVRTYVPVYQKERWVEHASELGMSQSEFVRTMVQAGRRGFSSELEERGSSGSHPRGNGLEDRVQTILAAEGPLGWDELVAELSGDFEQRLEDALDDLQSANRVRYSGRDAGYVVTDE